MANDTFELTSKLVKGMTDRENAARRNDLKIYKAQLRETSISPLYQRYIGNTVTVAHNGNFKKFPVDGSMFKLSEGHYKALMKYLHHVDRQIKVSQTTAKFIDQNATGDFKKI
jgi:hypothetical protein